MMLLDTDVFTLILSGNREYSARYDALDPLDRCIAIVTAEEILRGRLASIRAATSNAKVNALEFAYSMLRRSIVDLRAVELLPYTAAAHDIYLQLKSQKLRVGTQDLRIASIALAHEATLISRNRRDYEVVPSLKLEIWN